ncbi:astakine [Cephus cinctus]|uniref:Astakine n=1 Tax=Cephus cinctus TaxID=211228 RepID=A0AAJ7C6C8_CEPCN|nr:astakine [Cephus cinctus]
MTQRLIFAVAVMVIGMTCPLYAGVMKRPRYVQCQSSLECMPGNCCTIGEVRFSIPQCQPLQEEGDVCRPSGHATLNTTLVYPDGTQVELTDVHIMLCPCSYGMTCDDGICRDPSQKRGFNHLMEEASIQDD